VKARQRIKIKEIGEALKAAGHVCLDEQARVLGLGRSTTWIILQANHKSTGLSAAVINRMLDARELPPPVRVVVLQYAKEKAIGLYGPDERRRLGFSERLAHRAVTKIAIA